MDPRNLSLAAGTLFVDAVTAEVHDALGRAGIPAILLKGPAVAEWLYRDRGEMRTYGDTDLLVRRADWEAAVDVLRELGFDDHHAPMAHPRMESYHSHPWVRGEANVDLHATLEGLEADFEAVWAGLSADPGTLRIAGRDIAVLGPVQRAMMVVLHAAKHHRLERTPLRDLELALEQEPFERWREAGSLAERLDGTPAFASGLRLTPAGTEIARRLGVAQTSSLKTALRESEVPLAEGLGELARAPGLWAKLRLAARELVPTPAFMRWWSPLARRGRLGLALAYALRPLALLARLPRAAWAIWRAHRAGAR
jgi:hypothetical protein